MELKEQYASVKKKLLGDELICEENRKLFATFFEVPAGEDAENTVSHDPAGIDTHSDRDPFHYSLEDFKYAVTGLPMTVHYHGDWSHPRDQNMLILAAS